MAAYFKKQEEEKALAEDGDDAFLNSKWWVPLTAAPRAPI